MPHGPDPQPFRPMGEGQGEGRCGCAAVHPSHSLPYLDFRPVLQYKEATSTLGQVFCDTGGELCRSAWCFLRRKLAQVQPQSVIISKPPKASDTLMPWCLTMCWAPMPDAAPIGTAHIPTSTCFTNRSCYSAISPPSRAGSNW